MEQNNEDKIPVQPKEDNQKLVAGAILLAGIVIAGAVLLKDSMPSNTQMSGGQNDRKLNPSIAKTIGLDTKKFRSCLDGGKFTSKVQADIDDGVKLGVNGTPASFILKDGVVVDRINGAQPLEKVKEQISLALTSNTKLALEMKPISKDDHIIGNPNAKIIIVEYSDLECPFCKRFHETMHQVIDGNSDVAWVYRHYPIPQLHPQAFHQAEATECAWEQGGNVAFWKYTDMLYKITPSSGNLEDREL